MLASYEVIDTADIYQATADVFGALITGVEAFAAEAEADYVRAPARAAHQHR